MKNVLVLADAPCGITGFSNISRHILAGLYETLDYKITVVGVNFDGRDDVKEFPYRIIPATSFLAQRYNDVYGRQQACDLLQTGEYDIFFTIQDMAVISGMTKALEEIYTKLPRNKKFQTIMYTPVDSDLSTQRDWVVSSISKINYPVLYTHWGKDQVVEHDRDLKRACVCYHGVDASEFYPMSEADAKALRKNALVADGIDLTDKFVVLNVNRNQIRKDYMRTFASFAELKKKVPNAFLVALAQQQDQGGDLYKISSFFGLEPKKDWALPEGYTALNGFPVAAINCLYNLADVVFSSTTGEGWGLSSIEGMAVCKPCVFPGNTSLIEIFGSDGDRGRLIDSGKRPGDFICYGAYDSSLVRPAVNVEDAADKLQWVHDNPKEAKEMAIRGYEWTKDISWEKINKFWIELFSKVSKEIDRKRGIS
jgi:D-inositol-3-phosphate glycosyltransferase